MTSISGTSSAALTLLSTQTPGVGSSDPSSVIVADKDAAKAADAASAKAAAKLAADQQSAVKAAQILIDQRNANNEKTAAEAADARLQAAENAGGGLNITA